MKSLLVLGTIAALALSTTAEAKGNKEGHKGKKAGRQMVTNQQVYNTGTTRYLERAITPCRDILTSAAHITRARRGTPGRAITPSRRGI